jgi:carboxyl-terminal processing protease
MRFISQLSLLILLSFSLIAKTPELSPRAVQQLLSEVMKVHATHKELDVELVRRSLANFVEELDRTKTYFLKDEIAPWIEPKEENLVLYLNEIKNGNYAVFDKIYQSFVAAIERRRKLDLKAAESPIDVEVDQEEFKDLDWAENEEALYERNRKIFALQSKTAQKIQKKEDPERILKCIQKRRQLREDEYLSSDEQERERIVLKTALKSLTSSLDSQTSYFTPQEASQFLIQVQQRLFGIGAQLRDDLDGFTIVRTLEGGPAHAHPNIQANDRIIAVNQEPVVGMEITDVVEMIRGEEGTPLNLTLLRTEHDKEKVFEIEIKRGEVVIKEARIDTKTTPFADGVIATIALHSFYQDPNHSSCADIYSEINNIKKQHPIKGMILDLRQNSGGVLPQAVSVTGLFITKGVVCSIKDNQGQVEHLRNVDGKIAYDGPLVILVSKASASAAEIVAQTLQDYGRAIVVGDEHTFGKGTFQTFTLDALQSNKISLLGEYKVTRGRYYTVSGKSPQLVGVIPDIVIPGIYSKMEMGEKYSKYPLESDHIPPNFYDDLSDIPSVQRDQISWLYRFNLQQKIKTYNRFLPLLKQNAEKRMQQSSFFQHFLVDLEASSLSEEVCTLYANSDPQHEESLNVIKDLILLLN